MCSLFSRKPFPHGDYVNGLTLLAREGVHANTSVFSFTQHCCLLRRTLIRLRNATGGDVAEKRKCREARADGVL